MRIDGKHIADTILSKLAARVAMLKERGITPTLAVILVGDNPGSLSYVKQKQKAAETIGAKLELYQVSGVMRQEELQKLIKKYNDDSTIHGIIVQRPLPKESNIDPAVLNEITPQKDVDGFVPGSPYAVPVATAVLTILQEVFNLEKAKLKEKTFADWLKKQCSVVFGRGETAGKPIAKVLENKGCTIEVVHSQTLHPEELTKKFNIIVSCVGKERVITADMVTAHSILVGVGIWRDTEGKLRGDYNEDEIKDIVAYYTPTPGGVGPVNVASLMQNLVSAAQNTLTGG